MLRVGMPVFVFFECFYLVGCIDIYTNNIAVIPAGGAEARVGRNQDYRDVKN